MGIPAKRRTKQSKRERASHFALRAKQLSTCPKCKKPIIPHRICKYCGYYKGKDFLYFDVKAERKKKKAKEREDRAKGK